MLSPNRCMKTFRMSKLVGRRTSRWDRYFDGEEHLIDPATVGYRSARLLRQALLSAALRRGKRGRSSIDTRLGFVIFSLVGS